MRKRAAAIALAILVLSGVYYVLDRLEVINKPSSEMVLLRQSEAELALSSGAYQRSENDKGCYRDGKGAPHCERSIFFYYKSDLKWPELQTKLKDQGWKAFDAGDGRYRAWNNHSNNPVCLTHSPAFSESGSYLRLLSKTDQHCQYIIEQSSKS